MTQNNSKFRKPKRNRQVPRLFFPFRRTKSLVCETTSSSGCMAFAPSSWVSLTSSITLLDRTLALFPRSPRWRWQGSRGYCRRGTGINGVAVKGWQVLWPAIGWNKAVIHCHHVSPFSLQKYCDNVSPYRWWGGCRQHHVHNLQGWILPHSSKAVLTNFHHHLSIICFHH